MLFQLHHIDPDGNHDLVAQTELNDESPRYALASWTADVCARHPLSEGMRRFVCNEKCPEFFWATAE